MGKIDILNDYILKCDELINTNNVTEANKLIREIVGVYEVEIPRITTRLSVYQYYSSKDFINDLKILKAILTNYKSNLEVEEQHRKDDLEKLKLQQSITTINNQNDNLNNNFSYANASSTTAIEIYFEQAINNISNSNEILEEEKEELENRISALEIARKGNDKNKIVNKIGSVLKYISEKGIEVGIAVLPYLGEISKLVSNM